MSNLFKKVSKILIILWIIIYIFDSPVQYCLYRIGLQSIIIYSKALIPVLLTIIGLLESYYSKIGKKVLSVVILVVCSLIVAIINGLPFLQIAYGLKTIIPFLAFYFYKRNINRNVNSFKSLFRILVPIVLLGLIMDKYIAFPWEGVSYQLGDKEYQMSREWETFGIVRLSGFQRASYDSAIILCLLLVLNSIYNITMKKENKWYDKILCIGSVYGVYLTTFKSSYLFIVILIVYSGLICLHKNINKVQKTIIEVMIKLFTFIVFIYSIVPPIISITGRRFLNLETDNGLFKFFFSSYSVRMNMTWPYSMNLLNLAKFNGILGRGIGGIGTAQQYGEPLLYSAGDNIFIYLFVTLGLISIPLILGFINAIIRTKFYNYSAYIMFYILLVIFCFGATINIIDSPLTMSILGVLLAHYVDIYQRNKKVEKISIVSPQNIY